MDDRLLALERAAAAEPDNLGLKFRLYGAYQRGRRSEAAALAAGFQAELESPGWTVGRLIAWVRERCDQRRAAELFSLALDQADAIHRRRLLWILEYFDLDQTFPLLLSLAEAWPERRGEVVDRLLHQADREQPAFELYWRAVNDRQFLSPELRAFLEERLVSSAAQQPFHYGDMTNLIERRLMKIKSDRSRELLHRAQELRRSAPRYSSLLRSMLRELGIDPEESPDRG